MSRVRSKPYSRFSPQLIPGLKLWYDGADPSSVSLSGTDVLAWKDKSGNANNTTGRNGTITYTNPGVVFGGNSSYLTSPVVVNTDWTIIVVLKTTSSGGSGPKWWAGYGIYDAEYPTYTSDYGTSLIDGKFAIGIGSAGGDYTETSTTSINDDQAHICTFSRESSSGNVFLYVDGLLNISNTTYTGVRAQPFSSIYIGATTDNTSQSFPGTIYGIIVYDSVLTASQRFQVENFLTIQYGAATIDSVHAGYYGLIPYTLTSSGGFGYLVEPPDTRPFQPLDIADCQLWVDAADAAFLSSSGGTLSYVTNKAGQQLFASSYNTTYYTYQQYINLATSYMILSNAVDLTNFTFFFVGSSQTGGGNQPVFCAIPASGQATYSSTTGFSMYMDGQSQIRVYGQYLQGLAIQYGASIGNTSIFTNSGSQAGEIKAYFNGVLQGTLAASARSSGALGFGLGLERDTNGDRTYSSDVRVKEVLVYNRVLSYSEQVQIEGYLAWKWNIPGYLPSNQPFRYLKPYSTALLRANQVSGCALWLDASDRRTLAFASGSYAVNTWTSKVFSNFDINAANFALNVGTSSGGPTWTSNGLNGRPSIFFNGSNACFAGTLLSNTSNTVTIFVVAYMNISMDYANTYGRLVSLSDPNLLDYNNTSSVIITRLSSGNNVYAYRNSTALSYCNLPMYGQPFIVSSVFDGSSNYTYLNGIFTSGAAASSGNFNYSVFNIGRSAGTTLQPDSIFKGGISEVIVYNRALSTSERQQVEGYLIRRWNFSPSNFVNGNIFQPYLYSTPCMPATVLVAAAPAGFSITGYNSMNVVSFGGVEVTVYYFTSVGETATTISNPQSLNIDAYVIGGGGGGGSGGGGGGGGGDVQPNHDLSDGGTFYVRVGAGGAGGNYSGSNGDYSQLGSVIAYGGIGGDGNNDVLNGNGGADGNGNSGGSTNGGAGGGGGGSTGAGSNANYVYGGNGGYGGAGVDDSVFGGDIASGGGGGGYYAYLIPYDIQIVGTAGLSGGSSAGNGGQDDGTALPNPSASDYGQNASNFGGGGGGGGYFFYLDGDYNSTESYTAGGNGYQGAVIVIVYPPGGH